MEHSLCCVAARDRVTQASGSPQAIGLTECGLTYEYIRHVSGIARNVTKRSSGYPEHIFIQRFEIIRRPENRMILGPVGLKSESCSQLKSYSMML
jgi:hypothetical protein